jgi:hypothetical protein
MKTSSVELHDVLILSFKKRTALEHFESADFELGAPKERIWEVGEEFEVSVVGVDDVKFDVQFGDGALAFIRKEEVIVHSINDEDFV